jgi:hypothetical protein
VTINASDILAVTRSVTKEWTKQRKAEERGSRSRHSRQHVYSDRVNFTDIAHSILPGAYAHGSGGGRYTLPKRNFYYACREAFREKTGREFTYEYFATLLVQYMNRHPDTNAWKVTADPRGNLTIPNASHEVRVPCGTLQIGEHLRATAVTEDLFAIDAELAHEWPSLAGQQRFQAVLYIEKEGFEPMLDEADIAERHDLAIISCKGQSVVAARRYVDHVCRVNGGVPLFVVHDFDKAGFEISQRLTTVSDWARQNDRVAYEFENTIQVVDLGLRLTDVEEYGLADEYCDFNGHFARDSICTDEEKEFLRSDHRVELNAFTAPQFIEWIERKLKEHNLHQRLVPDDDILTEAYRRAHLIAEVNSTVQDMLEDAQERAEAAKIPKALRKKLQKAMADDPSVAWDTALYLLVKGEAE